MVVSKPHRSFPYRYKHTTPNTTPIATTFPIPYATTSPIPYLSASAKFCSCAPLAPSRHTDVHVSGKRLAQQRRFCLYKTKIHLVVDTLTTQ